MPSICAVACNELVRLSAICENRFGFGAPLVLLRGDDKAAQIAKMGRLRRSPCFARLSSRSIPNTFVRTRVADHLGHVNLPAEAVASRIRMFWITGGLGVP